MEKRVLYIHHGSARGGAALSLLYMLQAMRPGALHPVVCSAIGDTEVLSLFATHGYETCAARLAPFNHTTGGGYAYANPLDWLRMARWVADYPDARRRLAALIDLVRPDVLHFNSLVLAPYARVGRQLGIPTVVHVREAVLDGAVGLRKAWLRWQLVRDADHVVLICEDNARRLRLPPGQGTIIYEPLDFAKFDHRLSWQATRAELDIPADAKVVLFAGGSVPAIKGRAEFLTAMASVREAEPALRCLMPSFEPAAAPPPTLRGRVGRLLRRRGEEPQVLIARHNLAPCIQGSAFTLEIERYLAASDVVCVPHIQPHFSRTVVEAGAMKKPVVAFRIGGVEEVVRHEETGLLVPVGDVAGLAAATLRLLGDPALGAALGEGGYRLVRAACEAGACARQLDAIYAAVLRKG